LALFIVTLVYRRHSGQQHLAARNEGVPRAQPSTARPYKAAELLVKFQPGIDERSAAGAIRSLGAATSRPLKPRRHPANNGSRGDWYRVKLPAQANLRAVLQRFSQHPLVEAVEPNYLLSAALAPNDPQFQQQWSLRNVGQTGGIPDADIDADQAWEIQIGSDQVIVAVIDSGVDYLHPDLVANMWVNSAEIPGNGIDDDGNGYVDDVYGYDFFNRRGDPIDIHGHGTMVAGVIAAEGNNGVGITGVAWQARIMAVRFMGDDAIGSVADGIEAIYYAIDNGANIINASFGTYIYSQALFDAVESASDADVLFVASAGNDQSNNDLTPHYPASFNIPNVVAVANTDHADTLYSGAMGGSNYGNNSVHLGAPGTSILTTRNGGGLTYGFGTSFAAPHVAGAAALFQAQDPSLTAADLKSLLLNYGDIKPGLLGRTTSGRRLNVNNALSCDPASWSVEVLGMPEGFLVRPGEPTTLRVRLSSCGQAVEGGSVSATFDNGDPALALLDDGAHGDGPAGNGTYGNYWLPGVPGPVRVTFTASHPSFGSIAESRDGTIRVRIVYQHAPSEFNWIDATGGTPYTLVQDGSVTVPIGFEFPFYGEPQTSITISENGFLTFGSPVPGILNASIPNAALPNAIIAPYWDDLDGGAGTIYSTVQGVAPARQMIVAWHDAVPLGGESPITFQAILYESTGDIEYQYLATDAGNPQVGDGASATIGVEGYEGLEGTAYSVNRAKVAGGVAIRFTPVEATPSIDYLVTIGTLPIQGSAGSIVMSYVDGDGVNSNHVTIAEFSTDGEITTSPTFIGDASGTLIPGPAHLGDAQFHNQISQLVVTGTALSFRLSASTNGPFEPFPDSYAFYYLGPDGRPYPTDDPFGVNSLFAIEITGIQPDPEVFSSDALAASVTTVGAPVADISGPTSGQVGQVLTFSGENSYDPEGAPLIAYDWSFGDGSVASGPVVNHAFGQAGAFQVTLQVNDGSLSSTPAVLPVTIQANEKPVAAAGANQVVDELSQVALDGSQSYDPDGQIESYQWAQTSGPGVTLNSATSPVANFTAPVVQQLTVLGFRLTVTDNQGSASSAYTSVSVRNVDIPPVANAGANQTVPSGSLVQLDGSSSYDPDGQIVSMHWAQLTGPTVALSSVDVATPTFVTPSVDANTTLDFRLSITDDSGLVDSDEVTITVLKQNQPPVANAGPDRTVNELTEVTLDPTGSFDPDGFISSYSWVQVSGPSVTLWQHNPAVSKFIAPDVSQDTILSFQLTVVDNQGASASDTVGITVRDYVAPIANAGPDQTVVEGTQVFLDGTASVGGGGAIVGYSWLQASGPAAILDDRFSATPSFHAPLVSTSAVIRFRLAVQDSTGAWSDPAYVEITVLDWDEDLDGNGLADAWELMHFGLIGVDPQGDPDGDGLTNLQEFQQGTDPFSADPTPGIVTKLHALPGDENVVITWVQSPGTAENHLYFATTPDVSKDTGTKLSGVTSPFIHSGLSNGSTYYYVVTGSNNDGESPESQQVRATPGQRLWSDPQEAIVGSDFDIATDSSGNSVMVVSSGLEVNAFHYRSASGWSASALINDGTSASSRSRVAVRSSGDGVAIWRQSDGTRGNLWGSDFSASTGSWSPPYLLETYNGDSNTNGDVIDARIAVSDSGYAIAVWRQKQIRRYPVCCSGLNADTLYANYFRKGQGWLGRVLVDVPATVGKTTEYDVSINDAGEALVVWARETDLDDEGLLFFQPDEYTIHANYYSGAGSWSGPVRIESAAGDTSTDKPTSPQVEIAPDGNGIAVWRQKNGNRFDAVARSFGKSTGWNAQTQVIDRRNTDVTSGPVLDMDGSGRAVVIWGQSGVWANSYQGGGWSTAEQISSSGTPLAVALSESGLGLATWHDSGVYASHLRPQSGWGAGLAIDGGTEDSSKDPNVTVADAYGNAFSAWRNNAEGQIYAVRYGVPTVNTPPTADPGPDQLVASGDLVTLDGTGSSDSDGVIVSYAWAQMAGPIVELNGAGSSVASFTAPEVESQLILRFQLDVTDSDGAVGSAAVNITVRPDSNNLPPVAVAGADQSANSGDVVTLDGSASFDPGGTIVDYSWSQIAGPEVTLSGATMAVASFVTPTVVSDTELLFRLVITDDFGASAQDDTVVTVLSGPDTISPTTSASTQVVKVKGVTNYDVQLAPDEPAITFFKVTGDGTIVSGGENGSSYQVYGGPIRVEITVRNSFAVLEYYSVDAAGNEESAKTAILNW
jgi:serine protease